MNENEKIPEWIDRYNKNELHGKELEEFLAILKNDPQIQKEVLLDKALNDILKDNKVIKLRKKLSAIRSERDERSTRWALFLLAACSAVLLGFTIYYFNQWNELRKKLLIPVREFSLTDTSYKQRQEEIKPNQIEIDKATIDSAMARESRGDSSIRKRARIMFARNYNPYPPFESLVGEIMRDGFFRLIHPHNGDSFRAGDQIKFSWETGTTNAIVLEITNNNGKLVYHTEVIASKSWTIESFKQIPGLYYFKFLENDEMIYFGKFHIN